MRPRKALGELCWLPDSTRVIFTSLPNSDLLASPDFNKHSGLEEMLDGAPVYAFDIATGAADHFSENKSFRLASEAGRLVYRLEPDSVCVQDIGIGPVVKTRIGPLEHEVIASPDARFAIVYPRLKNPFSHVPVIVELNNPSRRHCLDGFSYRFHWTTGEGIPGMEKLSLEN